MRREVSEKFLIIVIMEHMSTQQFWTAISILLNNYHAVNRKLCACIIDKVEAIPKGIEQIYSTSGLDVNSQKISIDKSALVQHLQRLIRGIENDLEGIAVHFKCLLRKGQNGIDAIGVLDFTRTSYRISFACDTIDDFEVKLHIDDGISIELLNTRTNVESNCRWAEYVLKPKLLKWSRIGDCNIDMENILSSENGSLRLVDIENYNRTYIGFKKKYSDKALKLWNDAKESTDPLKFIYEDLAIAAYLITLWQSDKMCHSPQAFADLGCGNGLLVYILIEEGFNGYGYDIRSRKLWTLYPSKVTQQLIEQPVVPFKFQLPPDVDWLIGNHSDELSPWLPVLAATSHYNMNYFLLPCCAFEFSGNKFQRRNSTVSAYKDFCNYAESISIRCGFVTEKDRLKIPSTKRLAIIGRKRKYSQSLHVQMENEIKEFVRNEQQLYSVGDPLEVKLRDKVESVRNCTQIDKTIINNIVMKIFHLLLNDSTIPRTVESKQWQCGRSMKLVEIVNNLHKEDLRQIKSECGGLKTLLRNKHEIFELHKPDFVKLRIPQVRAPQNVNKPQTVKKRPCFFFENHPQGCPLSNEQCTFLH